MSGVESSLPPSKPPIDQVDMAIFRTEFSLPLPDDNDARSERVLAEYGDDARCVEIHHRGEQDFLVIEGVEYRQLSGPSGAMTARNTLFQYPDDWIPSHTFSRHTGHAMKYGVGLLNDGPHRNIVNARHAPDLQFKVAPDVYFVEVNAAAEAGQGTEVISVAEPELSPALESEMPIAEPVRVEAKPKASTISFPKSHTETALIGPDPEPGEFKVAMQFDEPLFKYTGSPDRFVRITNIEDVNRWTMLVLADIARKNPATSLRQPNRIEVVNDKVALFNQREYERGPYYRFVMHELLQRYVTREPLDVQTIMTGHMAHNRAAHLGFIHNLVVRNMVFPRYDRVGAVKEVFLRPTLFEDRRVTSDRNQDDDIF